MLGRGKGSEVGGVGEKERRVLPQWCQPKMSPDISTGPLEDDIIPRCKPLIYVQTYYKSIIG